MPDLINRLTLQSMYSLRHEGGAKRRRALTSFDPSNALQRHEGGAKRRRALTSFDRLSSCGGSAAAVASAVGVGGTTPAEGRAKRGLNLLKEHITTEGFSVLVFGIQAGARWPNSRAKPEARRVLHAREGKRPVQRAARTGLTPFFESGR